MYPKKTTTIVEKMCSKRNCLGSFSYNLHHLKIVVIHMNQTQSLEDDGDPFQTIEDWT